MAKVTLINPANASETEVNLEPNNHGFEILMGEEKYTVDFDTTQNNRQGERQSGRGTLRIENNTQPCYWLIEDNQLQLWLAGEIYKFEIPDNNPKRGNAQSGGAVSGDIKSPMPGSILQVQVNEGDEVTEGDALIIMESMKMEMTLSAPAPGVVKSIKCSAGDLTELNQLLLELELKIEE